MYNIYNMYLIVPIMLLLNYGIHDQDCNEHYNINHVYYNRNNLYNII